MAANDPLQAWALCRREDHLPQHAATPDGPGRRTRATGATTRVKVPGLYGTAHEGDANRACGHARAALRLPVAFSVSPRSETTRGYPPRMSNWNTSWTRDIWRPEERRLFVRSTDGLGWSINFAHLLRFMRRS